MNLHGAPDAVSRAPLAECAAAARNLLRERKERYPALIEAGKLDASAADRGLSLARALVAQWEWIVDPAAPALPTSGGRDFGHWNRDIADDVRAAAGKAAQLASRNPDDQRAATLAALYEALAWWQEGHERCLGVARVVFQVEVDRLRGARSAPAMAA